MSSEVEALRRENATLRAHIAKLEEKQANSSPSTSNGEGSDRRFGCGLTKSQVERYSRQMLLDDFRPEGTRKLLDSTVLVVGAGGLGSTVALYLAAAGIGRLLIVDFDTVERSNLHRQVIHNDGRVDMPKAVSAKLSCQLLNPTIEIEAIEERFDIDNAEALVARADVVVDASDNVAARYLINDACAFQGKPLVSGSAMRWEGQLSVYNHGPESPCYRCMFPNPPPQSTVGSCSDVGVVGAVPGMIGCLQALETQKVLMGTGKTMSGRLLAFNGLEGTHRIMKIRSKQASCKVCCPPSQRPFPTLAAASASGGFPEYNVVPCNVPPPVEPVNRATVADLAALGKMGSDDTLVVDVRDPIQYAMCNVDNTVNWPLKKMKSDVASGVKEGRSAADVINETFKKLHSGDEGASGAKRPRAKSSPRRVMFLCRRGVASAQATNLVASHLGQEDSCSPSVKEAPEVLNVTSGLTKWAADVDHGFPAY